MIDQGYSPYTVAALLEAPLEWVLERYSIRHELEEQMAQQSMSYED